MSFITTSAIRPEVFLTPGAPPQSGASAVFFGTVRDHHGGRAVKRLHYDCYVPMAECLIARIREESCRRHGLSGLRILHRVGTLEIGEIAIAVAAFSAHRAEGFAACEETVERIKHTVPIWKKEFYADGSTAWVGCSDYRSGPAGGHFASLFSAADTRRRRKGFGATPDGAVVVAPHNPLGETPSGGTGFTIE